MPHTQDIVQKLWNLCNTLKDDGVTYQNYVTKLTFLVFLKMAQETTHGSRATFSVKSNPCRFASYLIGKFHASRMQSISRATDFTDTSRSRAMLVQFG